jgi:hypothetical protein
MLVLYYYPIFLALAGIAASALLTERALTLMPAEAKAALIDSSSRTRMLTLLIVGLFLVLVFWRPLVAWVFLGCGYLALGARSLPRLRRLALPPRAARLILIGNMTGVAGISLCAFIFALRTLHR